MWLTFAVPCSAQVWGTFSQVWAGCIPLIYSIFPAEPIGFGWPCTAATMSLHAFLPSAQLPRPSPATRGLRASSCLVAHPGAREPRESIPPSAKDCQEVEHHHPAPASPGDTLVGPEVCLQPSSRRDTLAQLLRVPWSCHLSAPSSLDPAAEQGAAFSKVGSFLVQLRWEQAQTICPRWSTWGTSEGPCRFQRSPWGPLWLLSDLLGWTVPLPVPVPYQ